MDVLSEGGVGNAILESHYAWQMQAVLKSKIRSDQRKEKEKQHDTPVLCIDVSRCVL
jgi:hypothetical protein